MVLGLEQGVGGDLNLCLVLPMFYAVHHGKEPGVYDSWDQVKPQVEGFKRAAYCKCATREEAETYVKTGKRALPTVTTEYLSKFSPPGRVVASEDDVLWVVYVDGACPKNGRGGKRAGIGVALGPAGDPGNLSEEMPIGRATNQRAELYAIIRALESVLDSDREGLESGTTKLRVYTDSTYAMKCTNEYLDNWKRNGWVTAQGSEAKNRDLLERLDDLRCKVKALSVRFVKAHVGVAGNMLADRLARTAVARPESEIVDGSGVGNAGEGADHAQTDADQSSV